MICVARSSAGSAEWRGFLRHSAARTTKINSSITVLRDFEPRSKPDYGLLRAALPPFDTPFPQMVEASEPHDRKEGLDSLEVLITRY